MKNLLMICPNCAAMRNFKSVRRAETYTVRAEKITFTVNVNVCDTCKEAVVDEVRDQALMERAYAEYRRRKNLLSPAEILKIRENYGLSQRAFASLLGMAQPTIARYEGGALQDELHDRLIRLYSKPQNMKVLLDERSHLLTNDQVQRVKCRLQACSLFDRIDLNSLIVCEPNEYTGFRQFDFIRYAKTVVWFCWKFDTVATTKMNKLLFYADYLHFKFHSTSITGTAYRKLQWGPVPEHYGLLRDFMENEGYICLREKLVHEFMAVEYTAGPRALELELNLTEPEQEIMLQIANLFGRCSAREISERSHKERAWLDTPDRALISYMLAEHIITTPE